jgi:retron-type reverse transcriptase
MARRATNWWLRSPNTNNTNNVWNVNSNGNYNNWNANNSYGVRPALMEERVRVSIAESRVSIIKGGHILSPVSRETEDEHITPMPGVPRDDRLLCGAVWQHTATALRGRGRPAALRRGSPLFMPMQKTFEEICTFEVLYRAYLAARKGKRKKASAAQYEANALILTERLAYILNTNTYIPSKFEVFHVYEPKKRLVQAPAFVDKVVQHAIVDNTLYEAITRSFIPANCASQIDKGMHYGLDLLKGFMTDYWRKNHTTDGWVLKCDVRHFFASIDHDILKAKLRKKVVDDRIFRLMCIYIDASADGLPLGYQTSQLLALLFLDEFDHFVKERLRIKYYVRYMDDFLLIHPDKEYLRYCQKQIETFLAGLRLELNEKTNIFPLRHGVDFLGFHTYITESGQIIRRLRHSSVKRMKGKIRWWKKEYPAGKVTKKEILDSWTAWDAHAAHGNTYTLRQEIAAKVSEIIGTQLRCHAPIRLSKTQKAMLEYKQRRKASQKAAHEAAPSHHDGNPPW